MNPLNSKNRYVLFLEIKTTQLLSHFQKLGLTALIHSRENYLCSVEGNEYI